MLTWKADIFKHPLRDIGYLNDLIVIEETGKYKMAFQFSAAKDCLKVRKSRHRSIAFGKNFCTQTSANVQAL